MEHLKGLIAAPFTAMHADGSINLDTIEKQAQSLIASGVKGAFVCGTTGESMSLTLEERLNIAERWQAMAGKDLAVIVHVGHTCLADCKIFAAHAQEIGARGVAAMAPCFFKPAHLEDLVSFCVDIASAASDLPFYYYHIPEMTGVNFPMVDFLTMATDRIPNLAGIKFTDENLMDFGQCLSLGGGRFNVLFGRDEILLAGLTLGAHGAVGSTYSFAAPLYHRLIEAYKAGDLATAQAEQVRAMNMAAIFSKFGGCPARKAAMKMIGVDCGPVRLPLHTFSSEEYELLYAELGHIGFFSFCSKAG